MQKIVKSNCFLVLSVARGLTGWSSRRPQAPLVGALRASHSGAAYRGRYSSEFMRLVFLAILVLSPAISHAEWIPINPEGCTAEILFPGKLEKATWSGKCANGKIDGHGKLSSSNGTLLEGFFREGVPIDAKGRISAVRDDGRRVALGATYVRGESDFNHWKKPDDQISRYSINVGTFIRRNIVLSENMDGNPVAVVELKTEPNGRVASFKLLVSSGVPVWDEAVMRAVGRTEALPFDEDGTIPATFELSFRPKWHAD